MLLVSLLVLIDVLDQLEEVLLGGVLDRLGLPGVLLLCVERDTLQTLFDLNLFDQVTRLNAFIAISVHG